MKAKFIDIGSGVVLASAIKAILQGSVAGEDAPHHAILVLDGTQINTERSYEDIVAEVTEALESSPLADMVPEMADAFTELRQRLENVTKTGISTDTGQDESIAGDEKVN